MNRLFIPYCTKFANDRTPASGIGPKTGGAGDNRESGGLSLFLEERGRKIESFQRRVNGRLNIAPIHMLGIGQIRLNKLAAAFGCFGGVGNLIEYDLPRVERGAGHAGGRDRLTAARLFRCHRESLLIL
ncbi:hypothetical protein [Neorhizobium sp. DAR64872/K0K18]|uniref:hypothetical protein n=1 Tax=Neorhizobium sp. DAR64872/K0K18 TaxID=3421958 RepID=UPI003D2D7941